MSLLSKWLAKRNIEHIEDLTPEELSIYNSYKRILIGEHLTIEAIREFCRVQINLIEDKFASRGKTTDDEYLRACLHVYLNIERCITAKEQERKAIEDHLSQLINS